MEAKTWFEIECIVPPASEEALSGILMDLGATGTWSEINKASGSIIMRAYFETGLAPENLLSMLDAALKKSPSLFSKSKVFLKRIWEEDWLAEWKKHHGPLRIGKSLHILPEWREEVPAIGTVIRIDPGMAFGTGSHATTKLCLAALEEIISEYEDPSRLSLLDMGCGSGIIAIAGLKLGIGEAVGVDNDPVALENAVRNAGLNCVRPDFLSTIPAGRKFDIIISNIIAETHIQLKEKIMASMRENGRLVLSGILREKAEMVYRSYGESGLALKREANEGEWSCLWFSGSSG
ncbi:MAG: 50S ribosomal protein L11 methyltransferase [Nitrospinae bacterium]|nr:50S ribosomal protein L11 methyltransferase [Nitrospinota bacterium]